MKQRGAVVSELDEVADIPRTGWTPPAPPSPNWDDNGSVIGQMPTPTRSWASVANDYADIYSNEAMTSPYAGPPESFTAGQRSSSDTLRNVGLALEKPASLLGYQPAPTVEQRTQAEAEFSPGISSEDMTRAYDVTSGAVGAGLRLPGRGVQKATEVVTQAADELTDPVKALLGSIKDARPIEAQNAELLSQFRSRQAGAFQGALGEGEQGFNAALGAMRGQADRIGFTPLRPMIGQDGVNELFDRLTHAGLRQFEHASAGHALKNIMDGVVPVPSELSQLERAFPGMTRALSDAKIIEGPGFLEYVQDLLSAPQSLKSAFDLSSPRQLATSMAAHPIRGAEAFGKSISSLLSEGNYDRIHSDLAGRWYRNLNGRDLMAEAGVARADLDVGLTRNERTFIAKGINKLPLYQRTQRAYVTALNVMRDGVFQHMLGKYGADPNTLTQEQLRQWGRLINVVTGRGDLKDLQVFGKQIIGNDPVSRSNVFGTPIFWAPRLILSRMQLPFELLSSNPVVRKEAMRQIAAFFGVNSLILGLGKEAGLWDVEMDPESADFGQIKIKATGATGLPGAALGAVGFGTSTYDGYQRIDPWAGFRPLANLMARMKAGEVKSTTSGETFDKARGQILLDFLRTKFSPSAQIGASTLTGETAIGEPYNAQRFAEDALMPLLLDDLLEALMADETESTAPARPSRARPQRPSRPPRPSRQRQ